MKSVPSFVLEGEGMQLTGKFGALIVSIARTHVSRDKNMR